MRVTMHPATAVIIVCAALAASTAAAIDWPQKAGNPQRTSFTTDSPQPPFEIEWIYSLWHRHQEHLFPQVQAIAYQGGVFFGTKEGSFYRAHAGKQENLDRQIAWRVTGLGPILDTAAAADGKVIVASLAGQVHALATDSGKHVWKFPPQPPDIDSPFFRGFQASPLVVDGRIFIGARSGMFVALELASGKEIWRQQLPMPILMSAAAHDGRVFVGCEDLRVRAFDAASGKILWTSDELNGTSMMFMYPMVNAGKVVVRTWPALGTGHSGIRQPIRLVESKASMDAGKPFPITDAQNDHVIGLYVKRPELRSMYVLQEATGKEAFVPYHCKGGSNDGMNVPPAVTADGKWITGCEPGAPTDGSPGTWWGIARVDSGTGRATDFLGPDRACNQDEHMGFTVGGNILFVHQMEHGEAGCFGAMDLVDLKRRTSDKGQMRLGIPTGATPLLNLWTEPEYNAQEAGSACFSISGNRFYSNIAHSIYCYTGAHPTP